MLITSFVWDNKNRWHIARHGVEPYEAEGAILLDKPLYLRGREDKYICYATTNDGRYLFIVFIVRGPGRIRIISARNMINKEKKFYNKKRKV
ncbi:MAG: BrnT family toxin [Candidatus Omnitrophica bacterium]|nr:BrnT family toxin [Candidatus Omnitrophota bacterium]MBU0896067.1 BrnT family toxin [Candidatus Omnitrophota bacterium]MBU1134115.1 BrnT family toxin [Candidatus Omnitrophota bacterium]MBU1366467.1 BrnT family toxin [Candidatus Omnitrophota bacterium]MBU1523442.1 BrnT family toxin [Candidatus Omnitrophota bacterium]